MKKRPQNERVAFVLQDGTLVERGTVSDNDEFVFCLRTMRYYDRLPGTQTFVVRFWPHYLVNVAEKNATKSSDPLDVYRARSGLPLHDNGGWS